MNFTVDYAETDRGNSQRIPIPTIGKTCPFTETNHSWFYRYFVNGSGKGLARAVKASNASSMVRKRMIHFGALWARFDIINRKQNSEMQ